MLEFQHWFAYEICNLEQNVQIVIGWYIFKDVWELGTRLQCRQRGLFDQVGADLGECDVLCTVFTLFSFFVRLCEMYI